MQTSSYFDFRSVFLAAFFAAGFFAATFFVAVFFFFGAISFLRFFPAAEASPGSNDGHLSHW